MRHRRLNAFLSGIGLLLGVLAPIAGRTEPASSAWAETDHSSVRLVSASEAIGEQDSVVLGLHVRLADGWKIYWRSPGDAGFPPLFDWTGTSNLAAAEISWPIPERFSVLGFETLGYTHEVVLPITAHLARPGETLAVRAKVDYLACSEICIPAQADLALAVPPGPPQGSGFAHLISQFSSRVPSRGGGHGLDVVTVDAIGDGADAALRVVALSATPFAAPDVFLEGPIELTFGAPAVSLENGGLRAVLTVPVDGAETLERPLAGIEVTATVVDGDRGAERSLVVGSAPAASALGPEKAGPSWLLILALGLLGGLVLNLMPCVLPVLSIKLLGVIGHGGGRPREVRLGFLASAAGILFSFLVLAGALSALKLAGGAVGWGMQFQQPWFLVAMILVVTLFACNLWGFFEIRLPLAVADAGERASHVQGFGGHFLTGALATLLATPCSAPFLGTAISFALARGVGEIAAVFLAVGFGLALPYLTVAAFPRLATMLPRPGRWMVHLRRVLGLALAATAAWLVSILAVQAGNAGAALVAALTVAMAFALFLLGRLPGPLRRWAGVSAFALAALAFLAPERPSAEADAPPEGLWRPLDTAAISAFVGDGRVVLVNVTADWCITCKLNESLVLTRGGVRERLTDDRIVAMRGDWTRPDEGISRYLADFGRYGIPFDAVYGPGLPSGEALPELLTQETVLDALDRAAGTAR